MWEEERSENLGKKETEKKRNKGGRQNVGMEKKEIEDYLSVYFSLQK